MQIQNNNQTSFNGAIRYLNAANPIYYYSRRYFNRMAGTVSKKMEPLGQEIEGCIRSVALGKASAWDINPGNSDKYVLFLHGMAQNVSNYQLLYQTILQKGAGVFTLEYRGYGGNPKAAVSETKVRKDVENAYKYLIQKKGIKPENITVIGHSLGGCLAVNLAKNEKDIHTLVLLAPITSYSKLNNKFLMNKQLGFGIPSFIMKMTEKIKPLQWLINKCFNSIEKMNKVNSPTYIVQSKNDAVTMLSGATKLAKTAKLRGILREYIMLSLGGHKVDHRKIDVVSGLLDKII